MQTSKRRGFPVSSCRSRHVFIMEIVDKIPLPVGVAGEVRVQTRRDGFLLQAATV